LFGFADSARSHKGEAEVVGQSGQNASEPITVNYGVQSTFARDMLQEGPFFLVGLDQVKASFRRSDCHRNRRQSSAASKIEYFSFRLQNPSRLERLSNMPIDVAPGLGTDEVDLFVPAQQQAFVKLEPFVRHEA